MLKNCEECNRVFAHPARRLCQDCFEKAQKDFTAVKEYLQKNPGATVAEVARETEVDLELIYDYVRDGRLSVVPSDVRLSCQICGDEVRSGQVCAKCRYELRKQPQKSDEGKSEKESTRTKIHYLDQIKDR